MAPHFFLRLSRSFDWTTLLSVQRPSPLVLAVIPAAAFVQSVLKYLDLEFNISHRPLLWVTGVILLFVSWVLIRIFCPRSIRLAQDRTGLLNRGGQLALLAVLESDIDRFSSSIRHDDLKRTIHTVLDESEIEKIPAVVSIRQGVVYRSQLFKALRCLPVNLNNLDRVMDLACQLLSHQQKVLQACILLLLILGYLLLVISYCSSLIRLFEG